jgi:hypothetical protein
VTACAPSVVVVSEGRDTTIPGEIMKRSIPTYVAILVLALFGIGGVAGGTVAISMVNDNLKEQGIAFGEDTAWAGQQVSNGWDAYHFQGVIKHHVTAALEPAGFSTYEEVSAAARASVTDANPTGDAKLMGLRRTALDGNLLRGTLFSSFAWWMVGWVGVAAGVAFLLLAGLTFRISGQRAQLFFPAPATTKEAVVV